MPAGGPEPLAGFISEAHPANPPSLVSPSSAA
jgi:hypothetical protein